MTTLLLFLLVAVTTALGIFVFIYNIAITKNERLEEQARQDSDKYNKLLNAYSTLKKRYERWVSFDNAEAYVQKIQSEAQKMRQDAESALEAAKNQSSEIVNNANNQSSDIIAKANQRSKEIIGPSKLEAERCQQEAQRLQVIIMAYENTIKGYGAEWIVAGVDVLDELAEEMAHTEPGQKLKDIKAKIKDSIADGDAAVCDYAEQNRRETACLFIIDAFNGKVDSILSRVKKDNYGKLAQEMKDSFILVNQNGLAFRNARITKPYLDMRLEQLKWAVAAYELKEQQKAEQSRLRAQMREEDKARREIEKAQKQAAKEEADLQKAMEKARQEMEQVAEEQRKKMEAASAEQRAQMEAEAEAQRQSYEQKLNSLNEQLKEAEERSKRATSQAQLTKCGHVYIISNTGSFGEDVYKIGMTRRLEPLDRVKELGDASVPFPFDVHALIYSEDAPGLETALHKHFVLSQVNKVNHRREFFRVSISELKEEIEKLGIKDISWTMAAEAREYQETMAIERQIDNNPEAKNAWINRQFTLDDFDQMSDVDDSEEDVTDSSPLQA